MMINTESIVKIIDNTGGYFGRCIKVLNKSTKKSGVVGDLIILSIKSFKPWKKVKKKEIYLGLLVRTKKEIKRAGSGYLKFNSNSVILINLKNLPIGSRIYGPIVHEVRLKKYSKIISLASALI